MPADSESTPLNPEHLEACEAAIDYVFKDKRLLQISLTHASIAQTRLQSNERMEFLGDAILGAVVCDRLYSLFPLDEEGHLTQMKSEVVSRTACAQVAISLGLENYIHISKGLHQSPEIPSSVLAGVFESLIGAIYLDGGYQAAFDFINRNLEHLIHHAAETEHIRNSKSQFQHYTQRFHGETPTYTLIEETGPDHSKCFLVSAVVGETRFPPAWGSNKKEAEQKAALNALRSLQGQPIPYSDGADENGAAQGCGAEEQN